MSFLVWFSADILAGISFHIFYFILLSSCSLTLSIEVLAAFHQVGRLVAEFSLRKTSRLLASAKNDPDTLQRWKTGDSRCLSIWHASLKLFLTLYHHTLRMPSCLIIVSVLWSRTMSLYRFSSLFILGKGTWCP